MVTKIAQNTLDKVNNAVQDSIANGRPVRVTIPEDHDEVGLFSYLQTTHDSRVFTCKHLSKNVVQYESFVAKSSTLRPSWSIVVVRKPQTKENPLSEPARDIVWKTVTAVVVYRAVITVDLEYVIELIDVTLPMYRARFIDDSDAHERSQILVLGSITECKDACLKHFNKNIRNKSL